MTRKKLNDQIDRILIEVADANDLELSDKLTVTLVQSLFSIALERHKDTLVQSAISGNRLGPKRLIA